MRKQIRIQMERSKKELLDQFEKVKLGKVLSINFSKISDKFRKSISRLWENRVHASSNAE